VYRRPLGDLYPPPLALRNGTVAPSPLGRGPGGEHAATLPRDQDVAVLVPDFKQLGHVPVDPRQNFRLVTVGYLWGGCHAGYASPPHLAGGSLRAMTDADTAAQDGAAPPDITLPAGDRPDITSPERLLGAFGVIIGLVIVVIGLDLLTGWPSAIAASLAGGPGAEG
jgi:hypothetical protein